MLITGLTNDLLSVDPSVVQPNAVLSQFDQLSNSLRTSTTGAAVPEPSSLVLFLLGLVLSLSPRARRIVDISTWHAAVASQASQMSLRAPDVICQTRTPPSRADATADFPSSLTIRKRLDWSPATRDPARASGRGAHGHAQQQPLGFRTQCHRSAGACVLAARMQALQPHSAPLAAATGRTARGRSRPPGRPD